MVTTLRFRRVRRWYRSSNTATSPMNVWLLALGILITHSGTVAVGLVLIASTAATAWWLSPISRRFGLPSLVAPTVAVAALVASPLFASTVGMETFLGVAMLTGVARYALDGHRVGDRHTLRGRDPDPT